MKYSRGNQAVEFERFDNRSFLVRRTLGLLCVLALGLVIALPLYDPVLLLDLRNVQGRNLETGVPLNICLDLLAGRAPLKLGDVQPSGGNSPFTERCGVVPLEKHMTVSDISVSSQPSPVISEPLKYTGKRNSMRFTMRPSLWRSG